MRRLSVSFGAAALTIALALAGCGGTVLDTTKIEEQVKSDLEKSLPTREDLQKELGIKANEKVTAVDCPSGVDVKAGEKFTCKISFASGVEGKETFEIINKEADVHLISSLERSDGGNE
jgi:uncharacterized protein DUF4333